MGHSTINHKAAATVADGGQGSGVGGSRDISNDGGRGGGGDVSANRFDNDGDRQWQEPEQTTISQKVAEMMVVVATKAMTPVVTEAKTAAEGVVVTLAPAALGLTGAGNSGGK